MKIFVSGQILDTVYVHSVQKRLRDAGHKITHDWTVNETGEKMLATIEDKLKDVTETSRRAQLDIDGVINADAYVICTNNTTAGKGMYVELGAALALYETRGKPRIFVLGEMQHMTVFYFHPAVTHVKTIDELIKQLA